MRRVGIICIGFIFVVSNVFAQSESKQGEHKKDRVRKDFSYKLPKAGDFALGLDMASLVKSITNSITNAASGNPVVAFSDDFFGKYFITDNQALRMRFGININNFTDRSFVRDDAEWMRNPINGNDILQVKTVDIWKGKDSRFELGVGYEFRRTLWRVQGYVGAEIFGGLLMARDFYEYGNPMTETNQKPSTQYALNPLTTNSYRGLEAKTFGFTTGAALFIGADYFICRNLSIGAEFSLEGRYNRWGEQTMKTETWLFDKPHIAEEKVKPVVSNFGLNPTGRLNLMVTICGRKHTHKRSEKQEPEIMPVVETKQATTKEEDIDKPCYTIEEMRERIKQNKSIIGKKICAIKQVNFEFGKSVLTENDKKYLSEIVVLMKNYEQLNIKINGHTDNVGSEQYNMNLSKNRAKAVYDYLVKNGISSKRLSYEYFGLSKPMVDNDTEENRAINRRVEFEFTSQK